MPCKTINRGLLGILVCVLALVLFAVLGLTQPARAEVNASGNIIFPDANFKAALIGLGVDTGSDGEITPDEAAAYTGDEDGFFVVNHANISDLSGVEYFTGVSSLFCNNNILASLDVSGMINLEELHCDNNPLNTLNVSGCTSLLRLYVGETNITALDVSDCTQLEYIAGFDLTNVKFDGGREIITNVSPSGGGTLRFGYEATLGKMISLHAEPSTGMYFESWTTSENIELIYAQNIIPPLDIQIDLEALPTRPITITANFSDEPFEYASPTTALDDVLDEIAGKDADAILNELEAIDNLAGLLQNPVNEDKLAAIETAYIAKSGITADVIVDPDTHENFVEDVNVSAVGLAFNGQPTTSVELVFSPPEQQAALPSGSDYLTDNAVWVDIKLIVDDTTEITNLNVPIAITVKIPEGIDPAKLVILHYFDDGGYEVIHPRLNGDGTCTFIVSRFSVFAFLEAANTIEETPERKPAPVVPVLYNIAKSGDSFSFNVIVANGNNNMAGAKVIVALNEKYTTSVTIGADGVGYGTIEAPGFAGNAATFSARVDGVSGAASVSLPVIIYTTGEIVRR